LLQHAAPEPFFFRFTLSGRMGAPDRLFSDPGSHQWGEVWGMALYLPFVNGAEARDAVVMHEDSQAVCFWAGRMMPYGKLRSLPPFMEWFKPGRDKADQKVIAARVKIMLFFGAVSAVDSTKFRLTDDILDDLMDKQVAHAEFKRFEGGSWRRTAKLDGDFKKWNLACHEQYDQNCELSGRLPEPLVEGGTRYVQFSRLKYGSNKSSADYAVGDAAKLGVTGDGYGSFTGDKANRTLLVKVKAFIIAEATLDAAQRAKDPLQCAGCEVLVSRLPSDLYSEASNRAFAATALRSKLPRDLTALRQSELKKKPHKLEVSFVTAGGGAGSSSGSWTGKTPDEALRIEAHAPLPHVCVVPMNGDHFKVFDWRSDFGGRVEALEVQQRVQFSAGAQEDFGDPPPGRTYRVSKNKSTCTPTQDEPGAGQKGFYFNNGQNVELSLWKEGLWRLTYSLPRFDLTAHLYVRITPAPIRCLGLSLEAPFEGTASKPIKLGVVPEQETNAKTKAPYSFGLNLKIDFRDREPDSDGDLSNPVPVDRKQLVACLKADTNLEITAQDLDYKRLNQDIAVGWQKGSSKNHLIGVSYQAATFQVGLNPSVPDLWSSRVNYLGAPPHGLLPSVNAIEQRTFSRHKPKPVTIEVALSDKHNNVAAFPRGGPLKAELKLQFVSGAPLCLRLASSSESDATANLPREGGGPAWLHDTAAAAGGSAAAARTMVANHEPLPCIAVVLRDSFECALPSGCLVTVTARAGVADGGGVANGGGSGGGGGGGGGFLSGGTTARLDEDGVATFDGLAPSLGQVAAGGSPITLTFAVSPPADPRRDKKAAAAHEADREELEKLCLSRTLFVQPSRRPASLVLRRGERVLSPEPGGGPYLVRVAVELRGAASLFEDKRQFPELSRRALSGPRWPTCACSCATRRGRSSAGPAWRAISPSTASWPVAETLSPASRSRPRSRTSGAAASPSSRPPARRSRPRRLEAEYVVMYSDQRSRGLARSRTPLYVSYSHPSCSRGALNTLRRTAFLELRVSSM